MKIYVLSDADGDTPFVAGDRVFVVAPAGRVADVRRAIEAHHAPDTLDYPATVSRCDGFDHDNQVPCQRPAQWRAAWGSGDRQSAARACDDHVGDVIEHDVDEVSLSRIGRNLGEE